MSYAITGGLHLPKTSVQAVAHALDEVRRPDKGYYQKCDHFVAYMYGLDHSGFWDAKDHWNDMPDRLKSRPGTKSPKGRLHFWEVGRHWHVALDVGPGLVASNDIITPGRISIVRVSRISQDWQARYLGHTPPWFNR